MTEFVVPTAAAPIEGPFEVPPSKSIHQRALVLAALGDGSTRIEAPGGEPGEDVRRVTAALDAVGPWRGAALGTGRDRLHLDLGRGATGFRLLVAAATLRPPGAPTLVGGHPSLLARPHRPLLRALRRLGGHVRRRRSGAVRVLGGGMAGGTLGIRARPSSQYATALLLIAPRIGGLTLRLLGRAVSLPYLRLTLEVLAAFGIGAQADGIEGEHGVIRVPAGTPAASRFVVEPDASAAAAWWAAAALTGGDVWVRGLPRATVQADAALLPLLECMGAAVTTADGGEARVRAHRGGLRALAEIDLGDAPDLVPLVGVLAGSVPGTTRIRGAGHARLKESDRLATVAAGLRALGGDASIEGEDLVVHGGGLRGGRVAVAGDHRIAFAFGVLGLVVPGVVLEGADAAVKSHPSFLRDLQRAAAGAGNVGETPSPG
ncbi:MAG: 3-phosphoshikimate 1-carboxyvinyltransferase [Planctomycetota bacterium]